MHLSRANVGNDSHDYGRDLFIAPFFIPLIYRVDTETKETVKEHEGAPSVLN